MERERERELGAPPAKHHTSMLIKHHASMLIQHHASMLNKHLASMLNKHPASMLIKLHANMLQSPEFYVTKHTLASLLTLAVQNKVICENFH